MSGVPLCVDGENAFETVNNKANRATRGFIVGLIKDRGRIDPQAQSICMEHIRIWLAL